MSDDEPFLTRWSRRKREGERSSQPSAPPPAEAVSPPAEAATEEPEFDLSQLPALDSINAATDVRAFLMRGVPAALTREALRRTWAADPAIRDFIGPAENAWDFTAPDGVPGFGPILPPNPAVALNEVVQPLRADLESALSSAPAESEGRPPAVGATQTTEDDGPAGAASTGDSHTIVTECRAADIAGKDSVTLQSDHMADKQNEVVASRKASNADEIGTVLPRRRHGRALPQ